MRAFNRLLLAGTSPLAILIAGVWASPALADDTPTKIVRTGETLPTGGFQGEGKSSIIGNPHGESTAAIIVQGANAIVTVESGTVSGGQGGTGAAAVDEVSVAGNGGESVGIHLYGNVAAGSQITVAQGATVTGGTGGTGGAGTEAGALSGLGGGSYGIKVDGADNVRITNSGTITTGAQGVDGAGTPLSGSMESAAVSLANQGRDAVTGNTLINTATGRILGNGGLGVITSANGARIENDGEISTTRGQDAIYVHGTDASDRDGLPVSPTLILNRGTITGGSGRKWGDEMMAGTAIAAGEDSHAGVSVYNVGVITGGAGGSDLGGGLALDIQSSGRIAIDNFGTLAAGAANGSSLPRLALAFDQAGSQVWLANYQNDEEGFFGTIDGSIITSQHNDHIAFYGGMLNGSIYGLAQDATSLSGGGADVSFHFRPTIVTGNIGAAYGSNLVAVDGAPDFGPVRSVSLVDGGSILFTGDSAIHAGALNISNGGGLGLGTHKVTFHDYNTQTQSISGTLVLRTTIDANTQKHGYFVYTTGAGADARATFLDQNTQIVPTVLGRVGTGAQYVIIQDSAGRSVVNLPSVVNGGGYTWAVSSVTGSDQSDSHGVTMANGTSNVVITATNLNAAGAATGTGGAGVRALATYSGGDAGLQALSQAVNNLTSDADIKKAGAQLRPESTVNTAQASMGAVTQALGTIQVRTDAVRVAASEGGSGISSGETLKGLGVWGQVFGATASQDDRGEVSGYDSDTYGLAFGGDFQVLDPLRVGLSFAYAQTNVDSTGDRSGSGQDINSYITSLYGTYSGKGWYVDGTLTWGIHKYDATRHVAIAGAAAQSLKADYSGQQYGAKVESGLPLAVGPAVVTPVVSLAYNNLHQDSYAESGGSAALQVNSSSTDSIRSGLGAKASAKVATLGNWEVRPNGRAVWYHEFNKSSPEQTSSYVAGGSTFTTPGNDAATEHFNLGLGVDIASVRNTTISAKYDADLADKYVGHSASLQLRTEF